MRSRCGCLFCVFVLWIHTRKQHNCDRYSYARAAAFFFFSEFTQETRTIMIAAHTLALRLFYFLRAFFWIHAGKQHNCDRDAWASSAAVFDAIFSVDCWAGFFPCIHVSLLMYIRHVICHSFVRGVVDAFFSGLVTYYSCVKFWKVIFSGLFIYHCSCIYVTWHVPHSYMGFWCVIFSGLLMYHCSCIYVNWHVSHLYVEFEREVFERLFSLGY